nr:DUF3102 domain-containing protein [Desulfosporosinus orientis]
MDFSQSRANKMIRIFKEYGAGQLSSSIRIRIRI